MVIVSFLVRRGVVFQLILQILLCSSEKYGEGMEGHARAGDIRLAKYFPDETFNLGELR